MDRVITSDRSRSRRLRLTRPPSANRGVATRDKSYDLTVKKGISCVSLGIDWLTVTAGESAVRKLMADTSEHAPGGSRPGFKKSEERACWAGTCWRRWEPLQASSEYGMNYESWEWSSDVSSTPARDLRGFDVRPSRVDVAFDFKVPEKLLSDHIIRRCESWIEERGTDVGISGSKKGVNTRYVGSSKSDRRVRIYRRDLKGTALFDETPVLRVELILRGDRSLEWWKVWEVDDREGYRAAAAHVHEMMGLVVGEIGTIPERVPEPAIDHAQQVLEFFKQHGSTISTYQAAGFDVLDLAKQISDQSRRETKWRNARKLRAIRNVGVDCILHAMQTMLGRSQSPALTS